LSICNRTPQAAIRERESFRPKLYIWRLPAGLWLAFDPSRHEGEIIHGRRFVEAAGSHVKLNDLDLVSL
jgi:hypothetical protein